MEACEQCGSPLPARRKLKTFCSYACRGQHNALKAISGPSGLIGAKNTKQNKALLRLKRQSVGRFSFARINSCTYRLDRPGKTGAAWLMEVSWPGARQRWVARVGNRASEPLPLDMAKRAAVAMLRELGKVEPRNWIADLNRIAAAEVDRAAMMQERKQWPRDLVGAESRAGSMDVNGNLRDAILDAELLALPPNAEPSSGNGCRLEFYDDGCPNVRNASAGGTATRSFPQSSSTRDTRSEHLPGVAAAIRGERDTDFSSRRRQEPPHQGLPQDGAKGLQKACREILRRKRIWLWAGKTFRRHSRGHRHAQRCHAGRGPTAVRIESNHCSDWRRVSRLVQAPWRAPSCPP
jgi:hypothetical protein